MAHTVYQLAFEDGSFYLGATSHLKTRRRKHEDGALLYVGRINFEFSVIATYPTEEMMYAGEIAEVVRLRAAGAVLRNKCDGGKGGTRGVARSLSPESIAKMSETKRAQKRRCLKTMTEEQLLALHRRHEAGELPAALAREAGVVHSTLTSAWRRRGLQVHHWPRTGRRLSAETRAKMSAARAGRIFSPETCEKIAASKRGKPRSEETKAKIRAAFAAKRAAAAGEG